MKNNINALIKTAVFLAFFSIFSFDVFGQNCNGLNVSLGPDVEYCNGTSITLTATISGGPTGVGSPIYTWVFNSDTQGVPDVNLSATGSTYTIPNFNNTLDGTYIVTVTYAGSNCTTTDQISVQQPNNNNNFNLSTGNGFTICQGATANINSSVTNVPTGGTVTYSWTSNTGGYTSTNEDPSFNNLPIGNYTFTGVATANGCTDNSSIQITVSNITINAGTDITTCPGQNAVLNSTITNGLTTNQQNNVTYSWTSNNGGYTSTQADPTFNNLPAGSYNFTVNATYSSCTFSDVVNVNVVSPQINSTSPSGLTYCLQTGETTGDIFFSINLPNSPGSIISNYSINWNDGSPIQTISSSSTPNWNNLIFHNFAPGNHPIQLTMNLLNGCSSSITLNAFVGSSPSPATITVFENQASSCVGSTTSFYFNVPPSNVSGTSYTVNWGDGSPEQTFVQPNTPAVLTHVFQTSSCGHTVYFNNIPFNNAFSPCVITQNPCSSPQPSCSSVIYISEGPNSNFTLSTETACIGDLVTTINSSTNGMVIPAISGSCSSSTPYFWTITSTNTNPYTLSAGSSLGTNNGSNNTAAWQTGSTNIGATFNQAGIYTYSLRMKNTCGDDIDTHTLCVIPPPTCGFTLNPTSGCSGISVATSNSSSPPSCNGTPLQLQYSWSITPNNVTGVSYTISNTAATNPTFTFTNTTSINQTFTITLTVKPINPQTGLVMNSCASTCTQTVVVSPQPTFTTQPQLPASVCLGGTFNAISVVVNYLGIGTPTYQWYSNSTASSTGGTLIPGATSASFVPPATAVGTIYYYCVVTFPNNTNCNQIISNNVPAIVVPDPVASATPATQTICVGGTVPNALTGAYTNGIGTPSYQWNLVGAPTPAISGATLSTYTPPAFSSTGTFNYTVTINTSGSGCTASTSAEIAVVVVPDPTITVPIATQTLCQNATPTALTVTASGGSGTLQYQWYSNTVNNTTNGTLINGATNNTYTPPTSTVGTLYYYCVVTTPVSGCSVTSAVSTVIVIPAPTFTTQPAASNVCVGGTPTQMCVSFINGTGTPSYQWYSNAANNTTTGTAISGATASCYSPPATTVGTTYYYAVISLTGGGCSVITSNIAAVVITPDPVLTTQPTSTQTICVGGSSSALTVALQASTGIGAFSYQWYSNTTASNSGGTSIVGANATTYNPSVFNAAGTFYYYCVVTDAGNGCGTVTSQVATVVVVVDPTISVQPLATQTLCQTAAPTPLTVTASGGTGTLLYQWYSNAANNTTSGTLISGATANTYAPPTATVGTMYYYCVVTTAASGCSVTSTTAAIIVTQAPTFTTQPAPSNVCVGGTPSQMCVVYANGTGTAAYQWYSNSANNTTGGTQIAGETASCYTPPSTTAGTTYYYAVITLTGGGCSSITSNTAAVIITPDPVLATQPTASQTFCVGGSSAPLTVALQASTGIGAFTYQWYSNTTATNSGGTLIGSATAATYNPPVFNTAGTFYYYCVVTDAGNGCGTVTSQVATIIVVVDPTISAQPLAMQTLCQTATPAVLSVTASGGTGTLLYQWYSNTANNTTSGTSIGSATSATYTPPTTTVGTVYYYCVITTAASGCSVTSAASAVIVNPAPTFTTQPAASNVCVGGTTNQMCVAYTNGTGTATYQWFSNANNSTTGGTPIGSATLNCYTPSSATAGTTYYYAIISLAGGGCSSITSNTAEVIISTGTSLSTQPTPSQTICVGGTIPAPLSVSYAGGAGTPSYQWYSSPSNTAIVGATSTTYSPPVFNSAGTNSYYVTVTLPGAGCGAQTSNTANIDVVADPTATISSNASYCQNAGNVSQLAVVVTGGNGTPSYQWYSNTANSNTGGSMISGATAISYSPPVATTGTTYYYCMITQSGTNCAVNSPAAQIIVTPAPTFTTQPTTTQSVCIGGTTTQLNVAYSNGTGTATYQWYANSSNSYSGGTAIPLQTNASFTPPSVASSTIYYYCIVSFSASGGCSMINSNIAEVIVVPDPTISAQPLTTQTICVGGTIPTALNIAYTGGVGTPAYQWFAGTPTSSISGATASSYTPPVFTIAGTSNYYATISLSGSGCDALTSTNGTVIVVADPTATISSGASYCQNAGSVVALAVVVSGGQGTPTYQWYSNTANSNTGGSMISGATAISYSPPVATTGTTYYYCMITQSGTNCAVNSPTSQIVVTPAPTFTTQPAATQSVCVGGATTQLSVAYSNGTGTATYQWYANSSNSYSGGTAIPLQTNASFTPPSVASSTIYYYCIVSFSASGGCSMINSNIAEVVVVPDPTISAQPLTTQTICVGGTIPAVLNVAYTGGVGTPNYQWFSLPSSSISGATNSTYTPPTFITPGTYNYYATISLTGSGCDALSSTNATVIVVADPTTTISTGASYCQNAGSVVSLSVVVSNGQGNPSYQWYSNASNSNTGGTIISGANAISYAPPVGNTGTTYYYCVVSQSGANCGVNSPTAQIIVTPAPAFTTQPAATQSVCVGGATTQLSVAYTNGTGTASYQWYSNTSNTYAGGTAIATATGTNYTPPSSTSGTTYYYCIISFSASGGCSMISSNISTVIVVPDPTVSTQPFSAQTICVGGTIPAALNVAYSGGVGTPNYQWFSLPSSSISGATNSTYTPPTFITPGTYNYYATISLTGSGCDVLTSTNATITVVADPIVSAQPTVTQSVCQNTATSQISVSVTGGNGSATYQWFSNTSNSNTGGTTIVGATLNTYAPPSNVVGTQYYYCVINQSGANCGVTSNPAAVVVNLAPAISTQPLGTQQLCLNATTTSLQVAYSNGTGLPTYQWYLNTTNSAVGGTQINAATNNIFSPPSNVAGTYYYYCVISFVSGGGCPSITSSVSQVIVHPYPIVTITGGETICLLESSDINFAFTPSSGLYDITYTANGQSVTLDNYNGANPVYTVTPSQTTTYVVTNIAYDQVPQCAIQPNTSIVINVNPLPALNQSVYTFCSDVATTSLQYIPDANTYTYNWLPNTSANYPGQNNGPTLINVTLPNPIGNAPTNFYYVTNLINNATGCHALDSILVTINPNPVGTFTLPTTGCINSPIALSNGDATIGSYEWSIDGTIYSLLANPAPPVFTVLGDHTIEMVAINQYGCTDTLNSVIQIYDLPVANFTTDLDYGCAPVDVNFTNLSSGLYVTSYDWTFAPDTVSWNYQYSSANLVDPPSVTYLQGDVTTIYTATLAVTNACGTVTAQHDITVLPTPVAEFTLATHTICSGSSLVLNNISVGEPLTYYWTYGNTISYNPNLLSMYFPSDSVTHVYPLTLTLTNACGTDTYIDSVTVLPDLINGGFITTADAGCSPLTVTLTNTTFNTSLSSTWHLDDPLNTIVSNQNSVQFTYYATNNIAQNYNPYLVVTDGCASDTIVANLNVFANPLPIISTSQSNLCAGTTINFSGAITGGDTGFGYNWDFGGLGTSTSATTSFTFPAGNAQGLAIPITLTATSPTFSGTNCTNTTTTVIHVYNNPDLSQISFNTTSGCSDLGVTVSNLPAATNQINWGDGTTNFNNSHIYVNNGPALQSYPVAVTSNITYGTIPALSCSTIANQLVNVYPTPLPQIFASGINVCEGDNIDLIASTSNNQNTGITYLWNFGTLGTSTNGNTSISFNNGNSAGLQTPVQLTAFQNTSGTICSATVNDNVFVYDTPDLTTALYSNVNSCSPLLVSITNLPTSTYLYNWGDGTTTSNPNHLYLNQGTTPLTYNVNIDATSYYPTLPLLACNAIANQIVQVNPQPFAAFALAPPEECLYTPVTATLQNTSLNAIAPYVWIYDGIAHNTNSLNYSATFNTAGAHPVELIVSNEFGCTDSVSHDFIIHELPTVTLNTVADDLCMGTTAEFEIDGTGISTSIWNFGDGTTLNLLNPSALVHYYSQPGIYSIEAIVTNVFGCSDTVTFQNEVIVHPSPAASFTTSSTTADIVYPYFEFYDFSLGAINYYWNFGDSNWSNDISPTHTYNSEGDYLVELTVSNEYNCTDVATQVIHVEGIVVYVPNAFTPLDYNGVNDVFKPSFSSTEGIEFYEFSIFDRWGKKIFKTNDLDDAWIGNSREHNPGDDNYYAQNDVYTWQIIYRKKARANDPQPDQIITGHVTIIR